MALTGTPASPPPDRGYKQRDTAGIAARLFVWGVWTATALIAIGCVYAYSSSVPRSDEWDDPVPILTGEQPLTLSWLWSQHNEHRIFLPRLVMVGLLKATNGDFRSGVYLNVALLIILSAAAILTSERVRGRPGFEDALFPALLLSLRHYELIFWMFECQILMACGFVLIALLIISRYGGAVSGNRLIICGVCCFAIPLCGAFCLPLSVLLAAWVGAVAIGRIRSAKARDEYQQVRASQGESYAALVVAVATAGLVVFYFTGLHRDAGPVPHPIEIVISLVELIGVGIGSTRAFWSAATIDLSQILCLLFTIGVLWRRTREKPADRLRILGLALFLAGAFAIDGSLAFGRAGHVVESRYFLMTGLLPIGMYFACSSPGRSGHERLGRSIQRVLSILSLVLFVTSIKNDAALPIRFQQKRLAFENAVAADVPLARLIAIYGDALYPSNQILAERVMRLHTNGIGIFRAYHPQIGWLAQPLKLSTATLAAGRWESPSSFKVVPLIYGDGTASVPFPLDGRMEIVVTPGDKPIYLRGIQLSCDLPPAETPPPDATVYVTWKRPGEDWGSVTESQLLTFHNAGPHKHAIFFVDATVDALSIVPVGKYPSMTITGIDLLVPMTQAIR